MPRLFIAVDLDEAARDELAALAAPDLGGKWSRPAQMHLTLRFLGSVAPPHVPELEAALGRVRGAAFAIALAGVGVFPGGRKPARVLWAGVAPAGPLVALKAAIDDVIGPDPESVARGYSPHVTLARFDRPARLAGFLAQHAALTSAPFAIDDFVLYESITRPSGAEYHVRARYPLSG